MKRARVAQTRIIAIIDRSTVSENNSGARAYSGAGSKAGDDTGLYSEAGAFSWLYFGAGALTLASDGLWCDCCDWEYKGTPVEHVILFLVLRRPFVGTCV